ncbi:Na(+)-translocating NADH-quinone reductase subunit A [Planctomycetes bacterium Pan216]|uniref:Na(+)-translocating NADH-quinone reductase subunit A n=1 Tax=Kolteria novifilia TaxID=2527975 RepID=A0A518AYC6_9BACT|nr:Na(+)-translocating NADH-quinone reductase subunit A [Planctomycetes bacterium Pan216]
MAEIVIDQGYDLHLAGQPDQAVLDAPLPRRVAVRPPEFYRCKMRPVVQAGDAVKVGTPLLQDKDRPELVVVSPASGTVAEVKRGARRALLEVSVDVAGRDEFEDFGSLAPNVASRQQVRELLLKAGLWPTLRQHPYGRIANPDDIPKGIFVSCFESDPFLPDANVTLEGQEEAFALGVEALKRLTDGAVHLGVEAATRVPCRAIREVRGEGVEKHRIRGPRPASNPAVQAFFVDRVKPGEVIWYLDPQDVAAIGMLVRDGHFPTDKVITLAGTGVKESDRTHYRVRRGTRASDLLDGKLVEGELRVVSGSLLTGTKIDLASCLGFYDSALVVIPEGSNRREFLGWLWPGAKRASWSRAFASALRPESEEFEVDTNLNGGHRACIQSGYCLKVCPTDVQPLFVWKAVSYGDLEEMEQLGITDCVSCGLCTYVCPSKIEIDDYIKRGLEELQKEG